MPQPGPTTTSDRTELAVPDYDQLSLEELERRCDSLTLAQVERVQAHATASGASPDLIEWLEAWTDGRREALRGHPSDESGGATFAHHGAGESTGSVSPQTTGPPVNPPSQGVPTNPSQPRG